MLRFSLGKYGVGLTPCNNFKFFNMTFYYTYPLFSKKDRKFYTGYTQNLKLRFELKIQIVIPGVDFLK